MKAATDSVIAEMPTAMADVVFCAVDVLMSADADRPTMTTKFKPVLPAM